MRKLSMIWLGTAILVVLSGVPVHAQEWRTYLNQADSLVNAKNLDSALSMGKLALEKVEALLGSEDSTTACVRHRLGTIYYYCRLYDDAERSWLSALATRKRLFGTEHPHLSESFNDLGMFYWTQGRFNEAESYLLQSLAIDEKVYGPDHEYVVRDLSNLANFYEKHGKVDEGEHLAERALAIRQKNLAPDDPKIAKTMTNLANLLWKQGKYDQAEKYHRQALAIKEQQYGPKHKELISNLIGMAGIYWVSGRYDDAEQFMKQALLVTQEALGPENPTLASSLNNLATIYRDQGKLTEAESLHRQALQIWEKLYGLDHPAVATALGDLANVLQIEGDYTQAQELLRKAIAIQENTWGTNHVEVASSHINLADLYRLKGDYEQADQLIRPALAILKEKLDPNHPDIAIAQNKLARLLIMQNKWAEAEAVLTEAMRSLETVLGKDHEEVAKCLLTFAELQQQRGNAINALNLAQHAVEIRQKNFMDNSQVLPEIDALSYSQFLHQAIDFYLSCLAGLEAPDDDIVTTAADIILSNKGQVSDEIFARRRALISESDSASLTVAAAFKSARFQLSNLYIEGPGDDIEGYRRRADSLTKQVDDLEADLSRLSASYRKMQSHKRVTCGKIESLLPGNSVLLEYIRYTHHTAHPDTAQPHYLVLVIPSQGGPVITDLGPASDIDTIISEYRGHVLDLSSKPHMPLLKDKETYAGIARKLYDLLLSPVERYLSDKNLVLIAPDGGLNLVSFAGLVDDDSRYLIEKFPIHYLSCGREMIRNEDRPITGKGLLAIGDADYDASVAARKQQSPVASYSVSVENGVYAMTNLRSGCGYFEGISLSRLPGTKHEIDLVVDSWRRYHREPEEVYFGSLATEDAFKGKTTGKYAVHLATHGYYIYGQCDRARAMGEGSVREGYMGENPLLQSGLFFAGANLRGEGADSAGIEDGVLTAYEVSAMDLPGTELVVLSACETGLGKVQQAEGVYGLRRAFQMAGVRTIVSALWPVPDKETASFMSDLYSASGETLPEKLRRIQLNSIAQLRSQQLADHPYSWGAFIAVGGWRPMSD